MGRLPTILIAVADDAGAADLELFAQIGAEGIALEASVTGHKPEQVQAAIARFREAITKMGPRRPPKRREGSDMPIIPRAGGQPGAGEEEPDEPDLPE